jgi:hypothetical protein
MRLQLRKIARTIRKRPDVFLVAGIWLVLGICFPRWAHAIFGIYGGWVTPAMAQGAALALGAAFLLKAFWPERSGPDRKG